MKNWRRILSQENYALSFETAGSNGPGFDENSGLLFGANQQTYVYVRAVTY